MNKDLQRQIITTLGVVPSIFQPGETLATTEMFRRMHFIEDYALSSGVQSLVLGISGGVDSSVAGYLCKMACNDARENRWRALEFIAVRLPYGEQADEEFAQLAIDVIKPHRVITVNIKPAVDAAMASLAAAGVLDGKTAAQIDFIKGNEKARERMKVQYSIAAAYHGLVIGTDHAAEALMGFFTKGGDGQADIVPLASLTKDQVQDIGRAIGLPPELVEKPPTADLEDMDPGKLDETAYGVTYPTINTYLKGGDISDHDEGVIVAQYRKTEHKRQLPQGPNGYELRFIPH